MGNEQKQHQQKKIKIKADFLGGKATGESSSIEITDLLVRKVIGPEKVVPNKKYLFKVIEYNREPLDEKEKKDVKWAWKKADGNIQLFKNKGFVNDDGVLCKYITFNENLLGQTIYIMPYMSKATTTVSVKLIVKEPEIVAEAILIVGTEQHSANYGNKMMFPAQALREVRENYSTNDHTTIIIFTDGYNSEEISEFKKDCKSHNSKVNIKEIDKVSELIEYLNKGTDENRTKPNKDDELIKVGAIKVFAHGLPSIFDFGLDGPDRKEQQFKKEHVSELLKESFTEQPIIHSYSCRTGNSDGRILASAPGYTYGEKWGTLVKPNESLAQSLADHLEATVYAYLRRSNYTSTWLDKGKEPYNSQYKDLEDESINFSGNNPFNWYGKYDEVLWNPQGAFLAPTVGDSPIGLPKEMYIFKKGKTPKPI